MKLVYLIIILILLSNCSAKWHYTKALKKGLKETVKSDTIQVTTIDSIPVIRHDTIVYEKFFTSKDTIVFYKDVYIPKTIREIRIENKFIRDTIKIKEKTRVKIGKEETKQTNAENKSSPFLRFVGRMWWLVLMCGIGIGIYVRNLLPF
jgi:hypothetical protein